MGACSILLRSYERAGGATMGMAADGGPGGGLSARARRTFVALGYREYLLFWVGAAFSNLGIWALFAGRLWLMHELTESPVMLGLVTVVEQRPRFCCCRCGAAWSPTGSTGSGSSPSAGRCSRALRC